MACGTFLSVDEIPRDNSLDYPCGRWRNITSLHNYRVDFLSVELCKRVVSKRPTSWVSSNRVPRVSRISRMNIDSSRARASSDESFGSKRPSKKVSTLEERQFDRFFFLFGWMDDEVFKQLSLCCALLGRLECEHISMEVWLYLVNSCLETRWRWYYNVNQSAQIPAYPSTSSLSASRSVGSVTDLMHDDGLALCSFA